MCTLLCKNLTFCVIFYNTLSDCHMNITVEGSGQGFLHSPFYPSNYPNDLHCVYHITTKPGYVTQLNFVDFNVESGTGCAYDWLQVSPLKICTITIATA